MLPRMPSNTLWLRDARSVLPRKEGPRKSRHKPRLPTTENNLRLWGARLAPSKEQDHKMLTRPPAKIGTSKQRRRLRREQPNNLLKDWPNPLKLRPSWLRKNRESKAQRKDQQDRHTFRPLPNAKASKQLGSLSLLK